MLNTYFHHCYSFFIKETFLPPCPVIGEGYVGFQVRTGQS